MNVWMSQREIKMIEKYLKPEDIMLEYGSGGSTLHFSKFVKEYYSVEHNREWFEKVKKKISALADPTILRLHAKVTTVLCESDPSDQKVVAESWGDLENSCRYSQFEEYIKSPAKFEKKFDAVLVDGRARPECAKFIYDFIEEGAYVFLHDYWGRKKYHVVEEKYRVIDHVKEGQSLVVLQKVGLS